MAYRGGSTCSLRRWQALGLLEEELDAAAVARFLRFCPGLSKSTIGELLGENEDFFLEVLDAFTATFDFAGAPRTACAAPTVLTHASKPESRT